MLIIIINRIIGAGTRETTPRSHCRKYSHDFKHHNHHDHHDCHGHHDHHGHHVHHHLHDVITKVTFLPATVDVLKWLLVTRSSTLLSCWRRRSQDDYDGDGDTDDDDNDDDDNDDARSNNLNR